MFALPEGYQAVQLLAPATDAAGRTSSYFSLKNTVGKVYVVFSIAQGNAATIALTLNQATAVAGTSAKALSATTRIWATENTSTTPVPTRQTDAASTYTTGAGTTNKLVYIEVDPSSLDVNGGFDCIAGTTGASNVANLTSALLVYKAKYPQAAIASPRAD